MTNLSLRLRSILLALVALIVFIPVTVITLDKAYTESLTQAKHNELKLMNLALVSAFELDGDTPYMPEVLYEEQLNLPDSGYIGLIIFRNKVVWKSASALNNAVIAQPLSPDVGDERFVTEDSGALSNIDSYFSYAFTAEFASDSGFEAVHFYILNNRAEFNIERDAYLDTLWQWLLLLSAGLLILLIVGINVVLAPVRGLIREIRLTASGHQPALDNTYPVEFTPLKNSINRLLEAEAQQRSRYKNSLGDLAHSLKTPLAAAMGTPALPDDAYESLVQIDHIIQRQLKRAAAAKSGWQASVDVAPVVDKLFSAMLKVHRDAELTLTREGDASCQFEGDGTDLMEMLGNVVDNACKAASSRVLVSLSRQQGWSHITIEDDGPGIPDDQKDALLERGERLDTYTEGQGIGLAVVADLVAIYEGRLDIADSHLGGAAITLSFPV
ncbi:ATP-binding protein [Alteromonas confluentis]|uniref:histidine kinase n=1 Tax=Alteromonas confluentis TaxID=1656094 RepID=A0A1E7Z768_9ALTE|nr:ATP-binding protein [Alteromonas confluentis]OFC69327.1 histidine kinase [Alteromonas confluentis]